MFELSLQFFSGEWGWVASLNSIYRKVVVAQAFVGGTTETKSLSHRPITSVFSKRFFIFWFEAFGCSAVPQRCSSTLLFP